MGRGRLGWKTERLWAWRYMLSSEVLGATVIIVRQGDHEAGTRSLRILARCMRVQWEMVYLCWQEQACIKIPRVGKRLRAQPTSRHLWLQPGIGTSAPLSGFAENVKSDVRRIACLAGAMTVADLKARLSSILKIPVMSMVLEDEED